MQAGEPHAAARAVVAGHQAGGQVPSPGAGHVLRMSGEIHDWLAGLRDGDPALAIAVVPALAALLNEGARLGEPLVVSTEDSWPGALFEALDRSYQEGIERATALRRGDAAAETLVSDIQGQAWSRRPPKRSWRTGTVACWMRAACTRQRRQQKHWPRPGSKRPRRVGCCRG